LPLTLNYPLLENMFSAKNNCTVSTKDKLPAAP